ALGVDTGTPDAVRAALTAREDALRTRLLPPTAVGRGTTTPPALAALPEGTRLPITTEAAATRTHADGLPPGVHQVTATAPDGRTARSHLIAAPPRLPAPPGRTHGLLVQLYSLLSHRSWGMGDLGDLRALADWAGRTLDAGFIQVNPLHAAVPGAPTDPSPYRPSSRRFPDPVHPRVEDIPEYAHVEDHDPLRTLIDRDAVWHTKREALELVRRVPLGPGRRAAYRDFLAAQGRALEDHATWYALAEQHGPDMQRWPAALRDPRSPGTDRARRELMDRID